MTQRTAKHMPELHIFGNHFFTPRASADHCPVSIHNYDHHRTTIRDLSQTPFGANRYEPAQAWRYLLRPQGSQFQWQCLRPQSRNTHRSPYLEFSERRPCCVHRDRACLCNCAETPHWAQPRRLHKSKGQEWKRCYEEKHSREIASGRRCATTVGKWLQSELETQGMVRPHGRRSHPANRLQIAPKFRACSKRRTPVERRQPC